MPWDPQSGAWPAAKILGERIQPLAPSGESEANPEAANSAGDLTIFTNLSPVPRAHYNPYSGELLAGNTVAFEPEIWEALPFTPKTDAHATTLAAAIAAISGTRKINLGIYSDSDGLVGTLLPGGQASTTDIPDFLSCCALPEVRFMKTP